jgi:anti-anti-sigma factor
VLNQNTPVIISIPGPKLNHEDCDAIRKLIFSSLAKGITHFILDLSSVETIDSFFLGVLMVTLRHVKANEGSIRLCHLRSQVLSILYLMKFDQYFEIHDSISEAYSSFQR